MKNNKRCELEGFLNWRKDLQASLRWSCDAVRKDKGKNVCIDRWLTWIEEVIWLNTMDGIVLEILAECSKSIRLSQSLVKTQRIEKQNCFVRRKI